MPVNGTCTSAFQKNIKFRICNTPNQFMYEGNGKTSLKIMCSLFLAIFFKTWNILKETDIFYYKMTPFNELASIIVEVQRPNKSKQK